MGSSVTLWSMLPRWFCGTRQAERRRLYYAVGQPEAGGKSAALSAFAAGMKGIGMRSGPSIGRSIQFRSGYSLRDDWTPRPYSLGELPERLAETAGISTVEALFHVELGVRAGTIG